MPSQQSAHAPAEQCHRQFGVRCHLGQRGLDHRRVLRQRAGPVVEADHHQIVTYGLQRAEQPVLGEDIVGEQKAVSAGEALHDDQRAAQ